MKKEITWSLMHPTMIDSVYMRRIINEASRYDVDSFELCGAFANPAGGLNGLLLFEPYPHAAEKCDKARVMETRRTLNEIVKLAGPRPVYLWHREIMMPKGMLEDRPAMLDKDGEFDLLGKDFLDFLRYKIENAFRVAPDLGGIVLTLTEADYSVIHNSDPDRYPPDKVVETIVRLFAEEHEKYHKRFILRSFGSIAADYEDILRGARLAAKDHAFDIETKITPYDFDPFLPPNPFLKKQPGTALNAECDGLGEFLGAGYLPAANVDNIVRYVHEGMAAGVSRYAVRLDRIGNCIFDCHEINIFAYHQLIRDPDLTADDIYALWAKDHWQGCEKEMTELARMGLEAVLKTNFVCGNVVFHKFPILPDWKWVAAGGSLGLYHNNVSLHQLRGEWGILSDRMAPGRDAILREKQTALKLAEEGLARIRALKERLVPREYEKAERVWRILNTACKAISAFTESLCAYFEDLESSEAHPRRLLPSVARAEEIINGLLADTSEALPTMESCCDGAPLPGDDLDRVYLKGLRILCREMIPQFEAEQKLRSALAAGSRDLILPGSFGDQYRIFRYMHASHTELKNGLPVRYAGNSVFPNGFFEVEMKSAAGGSLEIGFLPGCASECRITLNGSTDKYKIPQDGRLTLPSPDGRATLRIEKSGADYPGVISIRSC
ncbi:MAG: hypothetical protein J5944_06610 [Lentisphaeria bacterium]|nr:hypothetical protein [Lentisphaeria bacterium]